MNPPPRASRRTHESIFDAAPRVGVSAKTIRRWIAVHELIRIGPWPTPILLVRKLIRVPSVPLLDLVGVPVKHGTVPMKFLRMFEGHKAFRSDFSWTAP